MNAKTKKGLTIVGIIVLLIILTVPRYNKMVSLNEAATGQWAKVESSYQRRADLIPNLVNTVKGYAEHEKETLTGVIEARAKATSVSIDPSNLNPQAIQQFQSAQAGLSSALSKLMVVVERYPDLKANQNFLELQAQLEGTENRINVERNRYTEQVKIYNTYIKKMPTVIFANLFGFEKLPYYEAQEGAERAPTVDFN